MDVIKQWALGITVSAIVGAVILVLSPQGGTEKIVRTAVSLFLMCAILTPFMSGIDVDSILDGVELNTQQADTSEISETLAEQTKAAINEKIDEILSENGIKADSVNIDISIDEENNMTVNSVAITAKSEYSDKFSAVQDEIKSQLGIEVKIGVSK